MSWSVNIGSIAGTAIRIHVTFLLLLVFFFLQGWAAAGSVSDGVNSVVFVVLVFACVLAHEFGHIFTARAFGVETPDVTLLPIGGVARLARIPEKPREEFLIAIAGPLVNVAIGIVLIAVTAAHLSVAHLAAMESPKVSMIDRLAALNLFLAAFNMIPAFPMDGGRVLRALLAIRLGHLRATEIAAAIGQWTAFGFGLIGLLSGNFILIFIAFFVYLAAASEAQMVSLRAMSRDVPVTAAMVTRFATLTGNEHIDAAVETLLQTSQTEFPVVDSSYRLIGLVGRAEIIRALRELGPSAPVSDVMVKDIPTIERSHRLEEAFRLLQEKSVPAVGVVDYAGRLIGLVTAETVGEMLMVRKALPEGARLGPWSPRAGV
ncbi:MAG TPA: site-2 protease family protein [Xanthobacteraceae bacterium]|jgi:Zn-dependent protease/CBS domain-containing protein|nr:site-2 protease family protein [Xanthobacteraceae bacterium]